MNVKPATAKISSLALKHNLQVIKEKAPHSKIIAVVKANAYGQDVYKRQGIVHNFLSKSISDHSTETASAGRTIESNCQRNKTFVR